MKPKFGDDDYLQHIEDAIAKIARFMAGKSDNDFMSDDFTQDAVIRNLEVIGEAVNKLGVNLTTVLDTVRIALPAFGAKIASLRKRPDGTPP